MQPNVPGALVEKLISAQEPAGVDDTEHGRIGLDISMANARAEMEITSGNLGPSKGGGVLLGDEDWLLPNIHATMMKYFAGLRAMSGPMSQSFSQCRPAKCDQVPFS